VDVTRTAFPVYFFAPLVVFAPFVTVKYPQRVWYFGGGRLRGNIWVEDAGNDRNPYYG